MDRDDRESYELGELTEGLRDERGERFTDEATTPPSGPGGVFQFPPGSVTLPRPYDVERQNVALRDASVVPFVETQSPYRVTTVYDALPVNAQEFVATGFVAPQLFPGDDPAVTQGEFTFTVPGGVNAVLRGFRFEPDQFQLVNANPFTVTLFARGTIHRTYNALQLGQALTEFFPVYALAGPNQQFRLQFNAPTGDPAYNPDIRVWFIGQLLVDTGRELQYEPANAITPLGRR